MFAFFFSQFLCSLVSLWACQRLDPIQLVNITVSYPWRVENNFAVVHNHIARSSSSQQSPSDAVSSHLILICLFPPGSSHHRRLQWWKAQPVCCSQWRKQSGMWWNFTSRFFCSWSNRSKCRSITVPGRWHLPHVSEKHALISHNWFWQNQTEIAKFGFIPSGPTTLLTFTAFTYDL